MSFLGYFSELDMLKNRIQQLENQLQEEREEHREVYMKLKTELRYTNSSSNQFEQQIQHLQCENQLLLEENILLKEQLEKTT